MRLLFAGLFFLYLASILSCVKPPDYALEPRIELVSVNNTSFLENNGDSLKVTLYFEDGDGDLGSEDSINMFWCDSRVPDACQEFKIPFISLQGNHKAISGNIYATIVVSACLTPLVAVDTLTYSIQIFDRAGNGSNIVTTPNLFINCD